MQRTSRSVSRVSFRVAPLFTALAGVIGALAFTAPEAPALEGSFPQPQGWPHIERQSSQHEQLGPGVLYQRFTLMTAAGPLVVSLATVDLTQQHVGLAVATHDGVIEGKGERLSSMADRLGAELAINADYFDINETGSPLNVVLTGGHVLHQPSRAAAFVIDGQGQVHMGPLSYSVHLQTKSDAVIDIERINEWSPSVDLALVTPQLGPVSPSDAVEAVLEPQATAGQYRVNRVEEAAMTPAVLQPGQIGIVARGAQAQALLASIAAGDIVSITETGDPFLAGARVGIGGGPLLVENGSPVQDPAAPAPEETDVRNPVTGAGLSADGTTLFLVVVDGRRPALSIGLTRPQLASLFIALGAKTAMAFDSGGSSEMVIRHEGDLQSSVANTPSDGRERAIADGLFVMNTAPRSDPVMLLLRAPALAVLVGSTLAIGARATDVDDQPIAVAPPEVTFAVAPQARATIDAQGLLRALSPGDVAVTATLGNVRAQAAVRIVPRVEILHIVPSQPIVAAGGSLALAALATSADGLPIAVDASAVHWTSADGQTISGGTFVAGPRPARTRVTASVGGATTSVDVLSGEHRVMLAATPRAGAAADEWHYASSPPGLLGGVDAQAAPDGAPALRLAYDFSAAGATRAAYAQTENTLEGQPVAVMVDVFGDGNGAWLRGGYRNADGNAESVTIARHIDWRGWKQVRAAIPQQAAWPIVWTRLYLVESSKQAKEQGSVWFRNLAFVYPGP